VLLRERKTIYYSMANNEQENDRYWNALLWVRYWYLVLPFAAADKFGGKRAIIGFKIGRTSGML